MNTELFIARKMFSGKINDTNISKPIINIAIIGIALGLAVMIISVAVVTGFKTTIKNKVFGFNSHMQIVNYDSNQSFESVPISKNQYFLSELNAMPSIKHIQMFANKAGIIKTKENVQAVVIKAVGSDYDWSFFNDHIIEGRTFIVSDSSKTDEVIISKKLANSLDLKVGDPFTTSFIPTSSSENIRYRKFLISGIYETQLEDFDKRFIVADISHIQKLNNWSTDQISGFEITVNDYNAIEETYNEVMDKIGYGFLEDGSKLIVHTIEDLNPMLFDWLELLDMNVWVILIIITIVAILNMTSGLMVIILEKINMIGILKALGTNNGSVRKIFIYNGIFIIGKGLFYGNIIGLVIILIQHFFKVIPLDESMYFISYIPVDIKVSYLAFINIGSLLITSFMLLFPSYIVTKISPAEAIRFE